MKGNNEFKKRNSVNLLSLRMIKRPSIMKQRKSVLLNNYQPSNKNNNVLSNADLRVKNILSDILLSIDPDDKKNLEVEKKLQLIEQAKGSQNFDSGSDNSKEENNNYWTRKISSFKDRTKNINKEKRRFSVLNIQPVNKRRKSVFQKPSTPNKKRQSILNTSSSIHNSLIYPSIVINEPTNSIGNISFVEQKPTNYSNVFHRSLNFKDKPNLIPVFHDDNNEGFISYSNKNLLTFQSMCSELKRSITSSTIGKNDNNKPEDKSIKSQEEEKESLIQLSSDSDETKLEKEDLEKRYRRLDRKNNPIYDSLSDEENEDIIDIEKYINPKSKIKIILDCSIAIVTLILLIMSPIEIAFMHVWSKRLLIFFAVINFLFDVCYIIDFVLGFFTAYVDRTDDLIINLNDIVYNYLNTWFFSDLLTAIPITTLINFFLLINKNSSFYNATFMIFTNNNIGLVHLLKIVKFLKLFKISVNNYLMHEIIQKMIQSILGKKLLIYVTLLIFIICIHVLSCIFIFIGYVDYPNWIVKKNIEPRNYIQIYIAGIYFVSLTIFGIGYGDILSTNLNERVYNLLLLTVGLMLYSWLVSALSKIKDQMELSNLDNEQLTQFQNQLGLLDNIRTEHPNFPIELYMKIQRYIYYKFEKEQFNPRLIFECLPSSLQKNLLFEMYKPVINNFVFFKYYHNEEFILKVLKSFSSTVYFRKERIVNAGEFMEEMFFVKEGKLAIELPLPSDLSDQISKTKLIKRLAVTLNHKKIMNYMTNSNKKKKKKKEEEKEKYVKLIDIRTNEHYGDIMMLLNIRSPLSVRVNSKKVELLSLKKTDIIEISMSFPNIWRKIIVSSIYNMQQINTLIQKTLMFFYDNNQKVLEKLSKDYALAYFNSKTKIDPNNKIENKKQEPKKEVIQKKEEQSFSRINSLMHTDTIDCLNKETNDEIKEDSDVKTEIMVSIPNSTTHLCIDTNESKSSNLISLKENLTSKEIESHLQSEIQSGHSESYFSSSVDDSENINVELNSEESINDELCEGEHMQTCQDENVKQETEINHINGYNSNQFDFSFIEETKEKNETIHYQLSSLCTEERTIDFQIGSCIHTSPRSSSISSVNVKRKKALSNNNILCVKRKSMDNKPKSKKSEDLTGKQIDLNSLHSIKHKRNMLSSSRIKKVSNNVLNKIANNIEMNFQNLNNPEQFYSNAFSKIKNERKSISKKLDGILSLLKQI